jgi:hypothetical protein
MKITSDNVLYDIFSKTGFKLLKKSFLELIANSLANRQTFWRDHLRSFPETPFQKFDSRLREIFNKTLLPVIFIFMKKAGAFYPFLPQTH